MKPLQLYVNEHTHKLLKQKALDENTTVSELVRKSIGKIVDVVETERVPEIIDEETCQGHPLWKEDCGLKGCKYAK